MLTATILGVTGVTAYMLGRVAIANMEGKKKRLANASLRVALMAVSALAVQMF